MVDIYIIALSKLVFAYVVWGEGGYGGRQAPQCMYQAFVYLKWPFLLSSLRSDLSLRTGSARYSLPGPEVCQTNMRDPPMEDLQPALRSMDGMADPRRRGNLQR
jgi:hypothetical protein